MDERRSRRPTAGDGANQALRAAVRAQAREVPLLAAAGSVCVVGGADARSLVGSAHGPLTLAEALAHVHPADRRLLVVTASRLAPGGSAILRFRVLHADGRFRWLEGPIANHRETTGIEGHLMTVRDVTGEVEAREHLSKALADFAALARFGAAIESVHDVDALLDAGVRSLVGLLDADFGLAHAVDPVANAARLLSASGPVAGTVRDLAVAIDLLEPSAVSEAVRLRDLVYAEDYAAFGRSTREAVERGVGSLVALPVGARHITHVVTLGTIGRAAHFGTERLAIVRSFGRRLENALERASYVAEVADTRQATFRALGLALEFRDLETKGHTDRVVALAVAVGHALGLLEADLVALRWGAYLHDLGKVAVPDSILLKADRLTPEEFAVIAQHTLYGVQMCRDLRFLPADTLGVIRSHHERWDGSGYPDGLETTAIPLMARLFAVVDVYDALRSHRPYKPSWSERATRRELRAQVGRQFDPDLVPRLFAVLDDPPTALRELLRYGS